jgi:hypothetical protein
MCSVFNCLLIYCQNVSVKGANMMSVLSMLLQWRSIQCRRVDYCSPHQLLAIQPHRHLPLYQYRK